MKSEFIADISIKSKVDELHDNILSVKDIFDKSWIYLAKNMNELKAQMEESDDHQKNWQTYFDVSSFIDYCEKKIGINIKTWYQIDAGYKHIKENKPELLLEANSDAPPYTKLRLLTTKEAKNIATEDPKEYAKIAEKVYDNSYSRREAERQYDHSINKVRNKSKPKVKTVDPEVEKIKTFFNSEKENVVGYVKNDDVNGLLRFARKTVELIDKKSTRVESKGIRRIVVTNSAKKNEYALQVIKRAKSLNSKTEIVYAGVGKNGTDHLSPPPQLYGAENYWYMKDTLVIRERKVPFIETFASPGDIVENLNTAIIPSHHCVSTCHYCYSQANKVTKQIAYYNWDIAKNELNYEPYIHTATLTLWSVISHIQKRRFDRIPLKLNEAVNIFRAEIVKIENIDETSILQFLSENLFQILNKCDSTFYENEIEEQKKLLAMYYQKNNNIPLWLWVSEYSDILAIEPIAGQMEKILTEIMPHNPDINFMAATKSANGDCLLKHDGQNRVMINMNLNPEYVVNKYETGTSALDDRLELLKKLQDKGGYQLRLSFEPMLIFDGWQDAYKELIEKVASKIDLETIPNIILGSIRLRNKLTWKMKRNYPWSDLLSNEKIFDKAKGTDGRSRYKEILRVEQYNLMIEELSKHTKAEIILGAEHPDIWKRIGLDKDKFMSDKVYQYDQ
ncbi:hypothetical protein HOE22_04190 [Candidatus Woesearchaeota archaeon]|jgi:DNA repair photolyase|nr:hypothetical protein [Candidatus Neomarinimicrobiota bacterium]MBT4207525.1 hypothetical protein [Candidatus Woesearchaeota archaeon]MBT7020714.1 hypothetical protein [Candidatus Neomarinimicrobiota bacterium]